MKKFIFLLVIFFPWFAFTQNATDKQPENEYFFQKQGLNKSEKIFKSIEKLQRDFYSKPFSKGVSISEIPLNFNYESFTDPNLILRIKEKLLKSANQDTLLQDSLYKYTYKIPTDSTLTEKLFYSYNSSVNQCIITKCELDTVSLKWHFTTKEEYFYDQNGNDTLMILSKRNAGDNWAFNQKYVTTYDQKNSITSRAFYLWHNLTQNWWGQNKQVFEFDESGNKTLEAFYTWNDVRNKWQGSSKSEYGFDESRNRILNIAYSWNTKLFDWLPSTRQQFTYNEEGYQTSYIYSVWDEISKDWRFNWKSERNLKADEGYQMLSDYMWDLVLNRWIGYYKEELYRIDENNEMLLSYSWNAPDQKWEASTKQIYELQAENYSYTITEYIAQDSIVPGILICGFNDKSEISNIWITPSCPDQTCTALDSDRVEGNASILWNYNINGNFYATGGFCQIQMNNDKDMSQYPGIALNYKVLIPSAASFIIRLTETSGEVWNMEFPDALADTSGNWKQMVFSFPSIILSGTPYDGIFDSKQIKNIQMRLNVPKGLKTSGSVLIDNLSACNIIKNDEWHLSSTVDVLFDEQRNTISEISKKWDAGLQQFVEEYKYKAEFQYNQFGFITNFEAFIWEEPMTDWSNYRKEENDYDENGNKTHTESYSWNFAETKWIGNLKFERNFNEFGTLLNSIDYQWDNLTYSWLNGSKIENTYTKSGKLTSNSNYNWNNSLQKWIGENKHETVYNALDEEIKTIEYAWDSKNNEWKVSAINLAGYYNDTYNAEGKITAHVFVAWNETLNEWCAAEKYYYFYSNHSILTVLPDATIGNQFAKIYPNPATDLIFVRLLTDVISGTIILFNNTGQLITSKKITGSLTTIPVNNLPTGNYILRVETNGKVISKKLIVQ